jgi:hypothetical protein
MDIIDGFTGGGYVAGYFDATHMYTTRYSNKAAMLFMDVSPGSPSNTKEFCTVIAHELQHLINFSIGKGNSKNIWINEGLSLAAEYIYGGDQNARINYFNGQYGNTTIPYGNNFFVWDGYWEQQYGDVLADYATAYLFFRWLGIQAGNTTIYKEIVESPHADYRAVTGPALQIHQEFLNWETLLGAWMLANYYNQTDGFYGYKGKIPKLTVSDLRVVGSQYPLSPGEGVFSSNPSGSELPYSSEGNIYYIGLPEGNFSSLPGSLLGSGPYTGEKLLTFNGNTNEKGNNEYGYVVASRSSGSGETGRNTVVNRNVPGPIAVPPGKYPVSFRDATEKKHRDL